MKDLVNICWTNALGNLGINSSFSGTHVNADVSVLIYHVKELIYVLCVCEITLCLGTECTFFHFEFRWFRSWPRWLGRTWSSMIWCCSFWEPCSFGQGMFITAHYGQSSWCRCMTWKSVKSAPLTPVIRYWSCGTDRSITAEFSVSPTPVHTCCPAGLQPREDVSSLWREFRPWTQKSSYIPWNLRWKFHLG